jgi:phage baseplate assembly protein W
MAISIEEFWSEIDPRFIPDAQGRLKRVVNVAAVEAGIDNLLRTRKGERVMLPEFGTILPDIVFEPINSTAVKLLTRTLKDEIEKWDDRILIESVELFPDPDQASLSIRLHYQVRGFPSNIFKFETEIRGEVDDS